MIPIIEGKRILVTGGTGSLGRALVKKCLSGEIGIPECVTVMSRDESKHHQMRADFNNQRVAATDIMWHNYQHRLKFILGDIRDYRSITAAAKDHQIVFHVAALKHVPTCEYNPWQATKTNIEGAQNLVDAIALNDTAVEKVVSVSTDKVVKPINVMGMTKAIQERLLLAGNLRCSRTDFMCVRGGNMVVSRGSVVPLFRDQIEHGGPVTVTNLNMTRFLITLEDVVEMMLDALSQGRRGEIYAPNIKSARIEDIAKLLIGEKQIKIEEIGIRPGETMHELMVSEEELARTRVKSGEYLDNYYVIQSVLPELGGVPNQTGITKEVSSKDCVMPQEELQKLMRKAGVSC